MSNDIADSSSKDNYASFMLTLDISALEKLDAMNGNILKNVFYDGHKLYDRAAAAANTCRLVAFNFNNDIRCDQELEEVPLQAFHDDFEVESLLSDDETVPDLITIDGEEQE